MDLEASLRAARLREVAREARVSYSCVIWRMYLKPSWCWYSCSTVEQASASQRIGNKDASTTLHVSLFFTRESVTYNWELQTRTLLCYRDLLLQVQYVPFGRVVSTLQW
jgi:hypothetical protein